MVSYAQLPPVVKASVHDVRYFVSLLRGVNFSNRATITVTSRGLTVTVQEAKNFLGTAFIFSDMFDEYSYHSHNQNPTSSQDSGDVADNIAFEIPLNTFIECLNIFGSASNVSTNVNVGTYKKWKKVGNDSDRDDDDAGQRPNAEYVSGGSDKRTGLRMIYTGAGHPLTLLLAEDASGPTTTCEIAVLDPEPYANLPLDNSKIVLKIILNSSWFRDALSELDPSFDHITFISNPPQGGDQPTNTQKPILRIQATGAFASTDMDYPNDRGVLETFECTKSVRFSYRFAHISRTLRALQSSTKTSLRIDEDGLLGLQFLMPSPRPRGVPNQSVDGFIEYRFLALDD